MASDPSLWSRLADPESIEAHVTDRDGVAFDAGYGALVTLVLSVLPFAPVLGGAVAAFRTAGVGYLRGFGIGLLAGVFAAVPLLVLFVPGLAIAGVLGIGVPPSSPAYGAFLAIAGMLFVGYIVGFSGFGGLAGVWIRANTDWQVDPATWV